MINARIEETTTVKSQRARGQPPAGDAQNHPLDDKPHSVYEAVTRQMLEDLKSDLSEVKGRVNTLLWMVASAALADFVMRLLK